jgi:hypothetical protein
VNPIGSWMAAFVNTYRTLAKPSGISTARRLSLQGCSFTFNQLEMVDSCAHIARDRIRRHGRRPFVIGGYGCMKRQE